MFRSLAFRCAALVAPLFALAACDDATGVDGLETRVLLSRGEVDPAASIAPALLGQAGLAGVPLTAVSSIDITITSIQLLREDVVDVDDEERVVLQLDEDAATEVNLLTLPVEGGLPVAFAELEEGETFAGLRIFFEEPATITFDEAVSVGPFTLDPGTYPLFIPSGAQTGIKVPENFTVTRGADAVVIEFDAGASVRNITVAGATQRIIMPPVLGIEEE